MSYVLFGSTLVSDSCKWHAIVNVCITLKAHCYNGETLLAQDKCGEAVRGLQEGVKCEHKFCVQHEKT